MMGCGLLGLRNWHDWLACNPQMEYKSGGRSIKKGRTRKLCTDGENSPRNTTRSGQGRHVFYMLPFGRKVERVYIRVSNGGHLGKGPGKQAGERR